MAGSKHSPYGEKGHGPSGRHSKYKGREAVSRTHILVNAIDPQPDFRDQGSVLVQLGLLEPGDLPLAGIETALKVLDEKSVPSNQLLKTWQT